MGYLLGIDIGTSGTKTVLCDEKGQTCADVTAEYPCHSPRPGWSEQDPQDWWKAAIKSVNKAIKTARIKPSAIKAVGLSGQMHGLVCLNNKGAVLRRAILWNDQRTNAECIEITHKAGGFRNLIKLVANPALTGFTAPKILWVRKHEPAIYGKTAKLLLPKDYIRYLMTGEFATDVSDASGTLLLDIGKRQWCKPLLAKLGIDPSLLPRVYESPEITGVVHAEAARSLGIPAGTPVVGGGGDQAAGAVGNGIVRQGILSATMGTSGVVFGHADKLQIDPQGRVHSFCHAVPGKWHVMGVVLAAGGSLQWFRNSLCAAEVVEAGRRKRDPYDLLTAAAAKVPAGCEGLFFLPYLTGERTPHADPYARACFIGLTPRHGKAEMTRAVMEGATYAMRDSLQIMRGMGINATQIRLSGGGARSKIWAQIQADVYDCNTCVTNSSAGSAYGAMLLAGVGAGTWKTVPEACEATIRVVRSTKKNPRSIKVYNQHFPVFQGLYASLKGDFGRIAKIVGH